MKKIIFVLCCGVFLSTGRDAKAQTATFNETGTLQTWTVPCGVTTITVSCAGAQGGNGGGLAAKVVGTFTSVASGNVLDIIVGQTGVVGDGGQNGGGGGGSYVWNTSHFDTLLTAGAGGGGLSTNGGSPGGTGSGTRVGTNGGGSGSGADGTLGNGGVYGANTGHGADGLGGGGAGWISNGGTNPGVFSEGEGQGGFDPANGAAGGAAGNANGAAGGYGGGGGSSGGSGASGGGGGYNGGGGGNAWSGSQWGSGGGGGSYNSGTNQTNTSAIQAGNGQVIITWVVPAALAVTATVVSSVSCNGGSNGSAHGTVTGGGAPFTYLWTPSAQTNATATGLSAGTYTIGVSDACGHTASASVAITQPTAIVVTATTSSNVTCNAGSNGATASTVSGGTTPYTYSWTGGSTNTTATGLSAGTYTLNVTDMNGCTASASTVVTQPNVLSDTSFATANVLCHGDSSGSAFTTASGGTMPYTYLWTPGGGTTDTAVGLKAGSYTVTVSDACGASATASVSVTQPSALSITSHSAPDNGHGVGTAVVSVSGGVGPYTYLWAGGKTTDSIGGLTKGTYCVDVKDANGCKDSLCVVVKTTAGIDGITGNSSQIIVYPNPNNGQFTIESSISGASTVEIYNILGEKVFTKNLSTTKGTNQVNVSNQPNGVYLYRVISESGDLLGQGKITLQK